ELNVSVSDYTVRRVLVEAGLKSSPKIEKRLLSRKNIKARLEFAKRHQHWTAADWERVIWSDEIKVNRFNSDGRSWCWTRDVDGLEPRTVKHGGGVDHDMGLYDCPQPWIHVQAQQNDGQACVQGHTEGRARGYHRILRHGSKQGHLPT